MFDGMATRDKDPRKSLHVQEVPTPELGPGEALVAVMASAINYNTVWTSHLRAGVHLQLPAALRPGLRADQAARPAVPRGRLGRGRRGAARRPRRDQVEARRRGRRALPVASSWRTRPGTTTRCSTRSSGSGASRPTSAGWPSWPLVKANQLMPKPRPPHLGGGGQPRAGQLHRVPAARLAPRRQHEAGRRRADLGRLRRPRLVRHPDGAQRRRDPGLRGVLAGEGRAVPPDGRRAGHRPGRRGLPVLEGRAHPGPGRVAALRRSGSAS